MSEKETVNKTAAESSNSSAGKPKTDPTVIVAIVGAIVTITVAILGLPPLNTYLDSRLNPTPTPSSVLVFPANTSFPSDTPIVTSESLPAPTIPVTNTSSPTSPPPISTETPAEVMQVVISTNSNNIKLGQHVNFNARKSYATFSDGSIYDCAIPRLCTFNWTIYHQDTGDRVFITGNDDGTLSYTFPKRGIYWVTAYVCRSEVCDFASVSVTVR